MPVLAARRWTIRGIRIQPPWQLSAHAGRRLYSGRSSITIRERTEYNNSWMKENGTCDNRMQQRERVLGRWQVVRTNEPHHRSAQQTRQHLPPRHSSLHAKQLTWSLSTSISLILLWDPQITPSILISDTRHKHSSPLIHTLQPILLGASSLNPLLRPQAQFWNNLALLTTSFNPNLITQHPGGQFNQPLPRAQVSSPPHALGSSLRRETTPRTHPPPPPILRVQPLYHICIHQQVLSTLPKLF